MNMCESKLLTFLALGLSINCIQCVFFCGLLPSICFWGSSSDVFDLSLFIFTAEKFHCSNVPRFICPVSCRRTSRSFHIVIHRAVHTLDSLSPELSLWGWKYLLSYWLTPQVTGSSSRTEENKGNLRKSCPTWETWHLGQSTWAWGISSVRVLLRQSPASMGCNWLEAARSWLEFRLSSY